MGSEVKVIAIGEQLAYAHIILRYLRDRNTELAEFRRWMETAGFTLGVYISNFLPSQKVEVVTPLAKTYELALRHQPLIVNVLGAGEFLARGLLRAFPYASLAFIAARRVEEECCTRTIVSYMRLPDRWEKPAIVADPMLATGGTVSLVIEKLIGIGASPIIISSVIAAPEGIDRVRQVNEDIIIVTLTVDEKLNSQFFIVPGLGDAGDRSLGVYI